MRKGIVSARPEERTVRQAYRAAPGARRAAAINGAAGTAAHAVDGDEWIFNPNEQEFELRDTLY